MLGHGPAGKDLRTLSEALVTQSRYNTCPVCVGGLRILS